jgi:hypothetical protein
MRFPPSRYHAIADVPTWMKAHILLYFVKTERN